MQNIFLAELLNFRDMEIRVPGYLCCLRFDHYTSHKSYYVGVLGRLCLIIVTFPGLLHITKTRLFK